MFEASGSILITLLLAWAGAAALLAVTASLGRRRRRGDEVILDLRGDERREELRWAAIRFIGHGHRGDILQEVVCQATNCSPAQALRAIADAQGASLGDQHGGHSDGTDPYRGQ